MKEEKQNINLHPPSPLRVKEIKKKFSWPLSIVKSNL
jgi:hypothetical protein